jgi:hypothetical protein
MTISVTERRILWHFLVEAVTLARFGVIAPVTGVAFGMLPAVRAARLDPVVALRHE